MNGSVFLTVLIGGGSALLLGHRPWARFLAARRGLSPWHAGVLRANLAYNGAACLGAGLLLAAGAPPARPWPPLAAWVLCWLKIHPGRDFAPRPRCCSPLPTARITSARRNCASCG